MKNQLKLLRAAFFFCMLLVCLLLGILMSSCTTPPSQQTVQTVQNTTNAIVSVTVGTCNTLESVVPPPGSNLIALVCSVVGSLEKTVQVFVDQTDWANMQMAYMNVHGKLPTGMSLYVPRPLTTPSPSALPSAAPSAR